MSRTPRCLVAALVAAVAAIAGSLALAEQAGAASLLEKRIYLTGPRYDGNLPPCDSMLGTISSQFAEKESAFWNSAVQISGFDHVREVAYRPWDSQTIPRRFCEAQALMSDGAVTRVRYEIVEDGGFAGYGAGVQWCVVGYDRNWAYNPACRMAGP